jgi:preprotein translocase subunit SecA
MNQQREIVYEYRDRILEGDDMSETAREQLANVVERLATEEPNAYLEGEFPENWDLSGLYSQLEQMYPIGIDLEELDVERTNREALVNDLREDIVEAYGDREEELGSELMRALERFVLLQIIDDRWREHLHDMDYLRDGIHLRSFAQIDPLVAYKNEAFEMFTGLMNNIWEEYARVIFVLEIETEQGNNAPPKRGWGSGSNTSSTSSFSYRGGTAADQPSAYDSVRGGNGVPSDIQDAADYAVDEVDVPLHVETRTVDEKDRVGRNDPCWCGSGKKFKKCHGA